MTVKIKSSQGFALAEVLVSMIILGLAVKGVGDFATRSIKQTEHNFSRSQAITIAQNIIEFTRTNPSGWDVYTNSNNWTTAIGSLGANANTCYSTNPLIPVECTGEQMALADIFMIRDYVSRHMSLMNGTVDLRAPCFGTSEVACVVVAWMGTNTDDCDPFQEGTGFFDRGTEDQENEFSGSFQCVLIDFIPEQ